MRLGGFVRGAAKDTLFFIPHPSSFAPLAMDMRGWMKTPKIEGATSNLGSALPYSATIASAKKPLRSLVEAKRRKRMNLVIVNSTLYFSRN